MFGGAALIIQGTLFICLSIALRKDLDYLKRISLIEKFKHEAVFENAEIITIDGMRVNYPQGWGLIRPSNTTPCLVLRFEAESQAALDDIQHKFRQEILKILGGYRDVPMDRSEFISRQSCKWTFIRKFISGKPDSKCMNGLIGLVNSIAQHPG